MLCALRPAVDRVEVLVQSFVEAGEDMTEVRVVGVQARESLRGIHLGVARGQVLKHQAHGIGHCRHPHQLAGSIN